MLEAIKVLGEYETAKEGLEGVDQFIEKAKLKNAKKVICIVFRRGAESIVYDHTHIEDFELSESTRYLYKTTQHKRYDLTPTAKIKKITKGKGKQKIVDTEKVAENAKKRLFLWFNTYDNTNSIVSSLKRVFEEKQKEIFNDFVNKYENLRVYKDEKNKTIDEQANSILTIKVIENNEEKYLGNIDTFKNILIDEAEKKFSYRKSFGEDESKGTGFCCICKKNGEVLGFALPFSFYTVDKRGFAPDFIRKDSWKRLPICKKCARHLTAGKEFLDNYLDKGFYQGYRFYVIPRFSDEIQSEIIAEIKRHKEKGEYREGLLCLEDGDIIELLNMKGTLNLIFMFREPKQGGNFDIARYIEDVSPSWMKKLDIILKEIKGFPVFKEESLKKVGVVGKKKSGDLKNKTDTIGGLIGDFFPSSKETGVYSKYFIDVIGDILAQKPVNKNLLMDAFMREIRNKHVNENDCNEKVLALKSLMLLLFLNKLNLIKK